LVVNTDRRTNLIELRSREKPYLPSVAWFYPEDRPSWVKALPLTPLDAHHRRRFWSHQKRRTHQVGPSLGGIWCNHNIC
jgi:hypothetical protein